MSDHVTEEPLQVEYDITVVDGEHGRRLAALQSAAILEVLTWFHLRATSCGPASADQPRAGDRCRPNGRRRA